MSGYLSGRHRSPHTGSSVEFSQYRKYEPGDSLSRVDWRVFAKTDRFYIKEFEADSNLRCALLLDTSASMSFSSGEFSKFDIGCRIAAALSWLLLRQSDAVGLCCFSAEAATSLPIRSGPAQLERVLIRLSQTQADGRGDIPHCLHHYAERLRKRSLVILISDGFCDLNEFFEAMRHLRHGHHDICFFQLLDPEELEFPFSSGLRFVDLETRHDSTCYAPKVKDAYLNRLTTFLDTLQRSCHEMGIDHRLCDTSHSLEKILRQFLEEHPHMGTSRRS